MGGKWAYPWYWGRLPKGVFGIHADNNIIRPFEGPYKAFYRAL